jgi:hypothetical protein
VHGLPAAETTPSGFQRRSLRHSQGCISQTLVKVGSRRRRPTQEPRFAGPMPDAA